MMVQPLSLDLRTRIAAALIELVEKQADGDLVREMLAHAPAKQRTAVAAMLKTIFAQ